MFGLKLNLNLGLQGRKTVITPPPSSGDSVLLENGNYILLENGDKLLLG